MGFDSKALIGIVGLTVVVAVTAIANGEESNYERYVRDKDQIAIVEYFGDFGAFATLVNRGQRTADSYQLPSYNIDPRRETCFPGYPGGKPLPQNFKQPNASRILDLAGSFAADLPAIAKAEIKGSVTLTQKVSGSIKTVTMESLEPADVAKFFSAQSCPELQIAITQHRADQRHILIGDVYFVDGAMKIDYELVIKGQLKAQTKTALSSVLARIGLRGFSLDASVNGKLQQVSSDQHIMRPDVPAAFRPYYLDADDLQQVYDNYLRTGLSKTLRSYVNDETRLRSFVDEHPDIKRRAQTNVFESLATSRHLIPFDRHNETHIAYIGFEATLSDVRRILNLPIVPARKA